MKITVDIKESEKELFLALMRDHDFDFKVEEEFEVPQWQVEESQKRLRNYKKNPNEVIPIEGVLDEMKNAKEK